MTPESKQRSIRSICRLVFFFRHRMEMTIARRERCRRLLVAFHPRVLMVEARASIGSWVGQSCLIL